MKKLNSHFFIMKISLLHSFELYIPSYYKFFSSSDVMSQIEIPFFLRESDSGRTHRDCDDRRDRRLDCNGLKSHLALNQQKKHIISPDTHPTLLSTSLIFHDIITFFVGILERKKQYQNDVWLSSDEFGLGFRVLGSSISTNVFLQFLGHFNCWF